jgi:hypothetical protein
MNCLPYAFVSKASTSTKVKFQSNATILWANRWMGGTIQAASWARHPFSLRQQLVLPPFFCNCARYGAFEHSCRRWWRQRHLSTVREQCKDVARSSFRESVPESKPHQTCCWGYQAQHLREGAYLSLFRYVSLLHWALVRTRFSLTWLVHVLQLAQRYNMMIEVGMPSPDLLWLLESAITELFLVCHTGSLLQVTHAPLETSENQHCLQRPLCA